MGGIVIGVDGSPASGTAVAWATKLASRSGLSLVVVRAWSAGEGGTDSARSGDLRAAARAALDRDWCGPCREAGVPYEVDVLEDAPLPTLNACAERRDADLLVVGARGVGGFAGLRMGRVALSLAHSATVPLAIVPAPPAQTRDAAVRSVFDPPPGFRHEPDDGRAIVGVNGSAESLAAVGWLGDHPAAFPHVDAVFSAEPFLEWVPPSDPRSWHSEALRSLKEWVEPLHGGGLDVTTDVVRDVNPVAALLNRAQATGARTVVVGARPLGEVLRLRVGHSGMQLLHHSPLPTILVPATSTSTGP